MHPNTFNLKPREYLEKLTTERLLNYYKARRKQCYRNYTCENDFDREIAEYLKMVREILNTREHVEK